ncbi:hypothetical protein [Pseudomonas paraeruginosa]|uniref:hypothetical protein n=1 Tax=Pseudomonas paraeruginosa TaxID=2994495 RepID=UPI0037481A22
MGAPGDPRGRPPAALAVACIAPVHAGDLWLVYSEGEKPSRIFVVVDETYLDALPFSERTCQLETITILERPRVPDWVSSNMLIDCARKTLEEQLIQVSPRGGKLTTAPDQPARPASNPVGEALTAFACELGPKDGVQRRAARQAETDNRERGRMFLGPLTTSEVGDARSGEDREGAARRRAGDDGTFRGVLAFQPGVRHVRSRRAVASRRPGAEGLRCRSYRCARNVRQVIPCG